MAGFDAIRGIIIGVIMIAVGILLMDSDSALGLELLSNVGWVFSLGGLAVIALSIYSVISGKWFLVWEFKEWVTLPSK